MSTNRSRFSTVAEVAAALRVSKMTVYRLVEDECLPGYRIGRSIRIPTQAVWNWLEANKVTPNNTSQAAPLAAYVTALGS